MGIRIETKLMNSLTISNRLSANVWFVPQRIGHPRYGKPYQYYVGTYIEKSPDWKILDADLMQKSQRPIPDGRGEQS
ncbi:hypothetical protein GCM10028825_43620 [Spirosoma agri]